MISEITEKQYASQEEVINYYCHSSKYLDLTNCVQNEILSNLESNTKFDSLIKVGNFILQIKNLNYYNHIMPTVVDVELFEEIFRTPTGQNCKLQMKLDLVKDQRFNFCDWKQYFNSNKASNINYEIILKIIRQLQILTKLSSFI